MAEFRADDLTQSIAADAACQSPIESPVSASVAGYAAAECLPAFFLVGPPRTGSSWLYKILSPHVWLPSPSKETRFFDTHFERGLKWYLAHYEKPGTERRMGEVAPTYFVSAPARQRISELVPDAKIVCVFRNPVERLLSLYRLKSAYGMIKGTFEQALESDPEFMESSAYARHLRLWQRQFGAGNVLACIYDDLCKDPQAFVDRLLDFIGVERIILTFSQRELVHGSESMTYPKSYQRTRSAMKMAEWCKARRLDRLVAALRRSRLKKMVLGGGPLIPSVEDGLSRRLYRELRPEIEELEAMIQRDLGAWKVPG